QWRGERPWYLPRRRTGPYTRGGGGGQARGLDGDRKRAAVGEIGGAGGIGLVDGDAADVRVEPELPADHEGDELGQEIGVATDDAEDVGFGSDEAWPVGGGRLGAAAVEERDRHTGRHGGERARPVARLRRQHDGAVAGRVD